EDKVIVAEAARSEVIDRKPLSEALERDSGIEIVERVECRRFQAEVAGCEGIGAIGGHHGNVGIGGLAAGERHDLRPILVKMEMPAGDRSEITICGVIRDITLEEMNVVPARDESAQEPPPEGRVAV